jgi:hypothetical protein
MSLTELTSLIGTAISAGTLVGLIIALNQIRINRKQLSLSTISYCLEKFGKLDFHWDTSESTVKAYIDLVSEEVFFFQYKYLPTEIAYEWLDGMLDYIPLFDGERNLLNGEECLLHLAKNHAALLRNYPRVIHTFTIHHFVDISQIYNHSNEGIKIKQQARENLIKSMYINLYRKLYII